MPGAATADSGVDGGVVWFDQALPAAAVGKFDADAEDIFWRIETLVVAVIWPSVAW